MTELSRRALLTGVAATAATAAFGSVTVSLGAAVQCMPATDLEFFVNLSSRLTGIACLRLLPNVDPFGVASVYFNEAAKVANFDSMLQNFKKAPTDDTVATLLKPDSSTVYLCRSIILAWYLGAWYEPDTLKAEADQSARAVANRPSAEAANKPSAKRYNLVKCRVLSPTTYTQGWVWRVAQAHPMGYGNLQFGYWSEQPPKLEDFIS
jgi:hypothetical protein